VDLARRNTRRGELIGRRLPSVELPATLALAIAEPARQPIAAKTRGSESFGDIGADLVGGRGNRRPDGGDEILRARIERVRERADGGCRHARGQSAPAGVGGGDRAAPGIREQERHAIGRLDRYRDKWIVGNDDVRFRTRARRETIAGAADHHRRAMNLTKPHQVVEVDAQRRRHGGPLVVAPGSGTERPLACRKEVIGQGPQRPAYQRGSSGRLHPHEAIARLWSHHQP